MHSDEQWLFKTDREGEGLKTRAGNAVDCSRSIALFILLQAFPSG